MNIEQKLWTEEGGWVQKSDPLTETPQIIFVFGARAQVQKQEHFDTLRQFYPNSKILMCSTAGEIIGTHVYDNSLSVTAVHFEKTHLEVSQVSIGSLEENEAKGNEVASQLPKEGLSHVMVFSDGLIVNGTELLRGITAALPDNVSVTGGLVGDGADFKITLVGVDELPKEKNIVLVGFYGEALKVGYGSLGGWDTFGPDRVITRSKGNILYELDGKPALALYKEYLGELAAELPGSGLLFPMKLQLEGSLGDVEVIRTLLAVDENEQSMTFAGDMPEGVVSVLMKANFDRLVDGASGAAKAGRDSLGASAELAILISCIGRKLVLKERVEEETEAVRSMLGEDTVMAGFYSYGEICPVAPTEKQCRLHNQTMTITTLRED